MNYPGTIICDEEFVIIAGKEDYIKLYSIKHKKELFYRGVVKAHCR